MAPKSHYVTLLLSFLTPLESFTFSLSNANYRALYHSATFDLFSSRLHGSNRFPDEQGGRENKSSTHPEEFKASLMTRKELFSTMNAFAIASVFTSVANAEETSISACVKRKATGKDTNTNGGITNCVSTASVRQLDLYTPPWTFETTPEEAVARLKGVIEADSTLERVLPDDDSAGESPYYLKIRAKRGLTFDEIEFLINPSDKVVTFRSEEIGDPSVSDFGAIRKEMESIQKSAGIFGTMGDGFNTADLAPKQNGPLGQLKAFYGLQSGKGYEDVFYDE